MNFLTLCVRMSPDEVGYLDMVRKEQKKVNELWTFTESLCGPHSSMRVACN